MALNYVFRVLVLLLVATGTLRSVLPASIKDNWTQLLVFIVVLSVMTMLLRARTYEHYLIAALPIALAVMYVQPQRVASDGIFYFTPLHSVIVDLDLDFENEYRVLGAEPAYFERTVTGRLPNNFSVGPAFVWAPFYFVTHLLGWAGMFRPTGFGYTYFSAIATGTVFAGFFGVLCMYRLICSYFKPGIAILATLATWLGTFYIWYMLFEPSMSHSMAIASASWFFWLTKDGVKGQRGYMWLGAAGGVVALMRWQNVLFLPIGVVTSWYLKGRPKVSELASCAVVFLGVFSPQLFYWKALYGSFWLVPQGTGYIDLVEPELLAVLFSSRHGLLSWAPILWLGVLGIPGLIKKVPNFGISFFVVTLLAWYLNASVFDWWAGASFGSRRFDAALPGFAMGIAVCLDWAVPRIRAMPLLATSLFLAPLVVWNSALMGSYFTGRIPPDGPASFRQVASDAVEFAYSRIGYPPSWLGAWISGTSPATYDLIGAHLNSNNVEIRMGDLDALFLGEGWSLPNRGRNVTTRSVTGETAEVYVALNEPAPYSLSMVGISNGEADVLVNGRYVQHVILDGKGRAAVRIPASFIQAGSNKLVFKVQKKSSFQLVSLRLLRPGEF